MGNRVTGQGAGRLRARARASLALLCALGCLGSAAAPAAADEADPPAELHAGQCNFPSKDIKGTPWPLQRLLFEEIWKDTKGKGVRIAVIDSGVDKKNKQLASAVAKGRDFVESGDGTKDPVGHGTKVAGIIAARPKDGTGFKGIAPEATIIPIRSHDAEGSGNVGRLVKAINYAVDLKVDIINISQGASAKLPPGNALEKAVQRAVREDILIVASAGNEGESGKVKETYPAAYDGVLGVAASDRNNERAWFSQPGDFVDVAAPGVDIVSTVPKGGHCLDSGTSFAAPYVTGVAALVRAKHPTWTSQEVIWHLQETAERAQPDRNINIGWGVVDPMAALDDDTKPTGETKPDRNAIVDAEAAKKIHPAELTLSETPQERRARYGIYVFGVGLFAVATIVGSARAIRDWRRKHSPSTHGEAHNG